MRKTLLLVSCLTLVACHLHAQGGADSKLMRHPRAGVVNVSKVAVDFHPSVMRIEAPYPGGNSEKAWLAQYKQGLEAKRKPPMEGAFKVDSTAPSPWLGDNFQSNQVINGVPNDNDMAISNGGKIVSVINSNLYMHDADGTYLTSLSLDAWSATLGLNGSKFDPRALYDPHHDRFVVACLNGFTDSTSWVIIGFSQTNDPTAGWNLYALPGDPNNDSLWTDYPIMALTKDELFLTGNLLYNDQPWQTGFNQSICWQIDLDSAYAGGTLDSRLWFNVTFGNGKVRNLCPLQGGSSPAGPNLYLVSNRNFSTGNDTVFIMEITDTIHGANPQFLVGHGISDVQYSLAPNALQQFNYALATNDARWLDGFVENDIAHFVGNCLDSTTGRPAFYHGTISDLSGQRAVKGRVVGFPGGDYGYPAISWMGMSPADNDALIAINYCGPSASLRPGCGGIYYDGAGGYSPLTVAKAGLSYIDALIGQLDRWGDYTGVQLKYDSPGVVWMAGTFGKANRTPGTWIAEFHHPSIVGTQPQPDASGFDASTYPNPTLDMSTLEFQLEADAFLTIEVLDAQGRLVRTLLRDLVRAGRSRVQFSTNPLAPGVYFLRISDGARVLAHKRIVRL